MAWNETDREKYAVIRERYASDLSDEEFALIQPLLPDPKPLGRKATRPRCNTGKTPGGCGRQAGCPRQRIRSGSGGTTSLPGTARRLPR